VDATFSPGLTPSPAARRVTLSDVASHAKVSRATASLVLRNAGNLSDPTRDRVRASMDTLGYVYHRGAAALRANRTQSVGLVVPDISNGFTAELTMGVEAVLAESSIVTLMANSQEMPVRQNLLVTSMLERQVDGLLVIPAVGSAKDFGETLAASRVPTVIATRELPDSGLSYVGIDNIKGGRLAGGHLLFHGCQRIAYVGGFDGLRPRQDRIQGVRDALGAAGFDSCLAIDSPGPPRGIWGLETARALLAADELPDGIICHNDLVAFGVYRALREESVERWESTHVVSYDDVAAASLWEPPLTSVAASGDEVGRRCAEVLLRRISHPFEAPERVLVDSQLVVRDSCGCHRQA